LEEVSRRGRTSPVRWRLLDGEKMAALCSEFGISRKTVYKIYGRYKDCGIEGLTHRSRRPYRHANQLPMVIEKLIIRLKKEYPGWGAPKIRERLRRHYAPVLCPAISTVHAVLDRHGLVTRRRRRRHRASGTLLSRPFQPNELWCADYKGEFMLANRQYCYPLTITDFASRFLLSCEALSTTQETYAFAVSGRVFKEFGLPLAIRDNCVPFASASALYGLTKLAVWWLRLGIQIERIKPGHPEQNGRHERMHLTLKTEATRAAAGNFPAATSPLRCVRRALQPGTAPSSVSHEGPARGLRPVTAPLPRPLRGGLPVS
jgi:putative transposase